MSTRSFIGTTDGTTFDSIYCHFDGNPRSMVPHLAKIIVRDGADALPVLSGAEQRARGGATATWRGIEASMPSPDTTLPYATYEEYLDTVPTKDRSSGLSYLYSELSSHGPEDEARARVVEGYGIVDTEYPIRFSGTLTDADTGWCEWGYLFTDDLTLVVYEVGETLAEVGRFTFEDLSAIVAGDETATGRVEEAECGEDYSRCSHLAWVHDKTAPAESQHLSMGEWLGHEPIHYKRAIAATYEGKRYEFDGSSGYSSGNVWYMYVKGGNDSLPVYMWDKHGTGEQWPFPGVDLTYPPTKADVHGVSA